MYVSRFRFLIPAFAGLVLLLILSSTNVAPALADDPGSAVHLFRLPSYYQQRGTQDIHSNMTYHGGPVMLTVKAYLIFWAPPGHSIPKGYRNLLKRYFSDIGGSNFYHILTQYFQNPGNKHQKNISTFGGLWVDTTHPYPHAGTAAHPLTDADIQGEVKRAISTKGWTNGLGAQFLVFTAKGIESCIDSLDCTPGTAHGVYCAYHGRFALNGKDAIYANMPYDGTWQGSNGCRSNLVITSPNNNIDADIEISTTSHEHFEAANDPRLNAWFDNDPLGGWEIGDKCAYFYGSIAGNGSNLTLNGHPYIIQLEWSNANGNGTDRSGCVKSH